MYIFYLWYYYSLLCIPSHNIVVLRGACHALCNVCKLLYCMGIDMCTDSYSPLYRTWCSSADTAQRVSNIITGANHTIGVLQNMLCKQRGTFYSPVEYVLATPSTNTDMVTSYFHVCMNSSTILKLRLFLTFGGVFIFQKNIAGASLAFDKKVQ